ncbi:ATP phosphoribosyltransferase [Longirhabdus pacifica]|uniref:ATP phosphoribosyltransferase n=1 Tax=Longirhabdus pacifica TaxID=2305227 RepID=UPI001008CDFC|nr:ATP phosphoribosyltransferase [Longirhabdus pacifica]
MEPILRIAMPKGRIYKQAIELFSKANIPVPEMLDTSRKLIIPVPDASMEIIMSKPVDVPKYVEYGAADIGIVGKDVLMEEQRDVFELLDLNIAKCRMSVIGMQDNSGELNAKVATKYPKVAAKYFREQGEQVEIIKLNGSIELAPLIGLSDRIVDMVETGATIRENGLVEIDKIFDITSRLIANRVSYRIKQEQVQGICDALSAVIEEGNDEDHYRQSI